MTDDINALRDRMRRLEAESADLRRDYTELGALGPDGLRAKVVALTQENAAERARADEASADAVKAWDEARSLASKVRMLEFNANPAVAALDLDMVREERDAFRDNLRLALADVERLAGASVAEVLIERRREIRDLTGRLNDALARMDTLHAVARTCVETARVAAYQPCSERSWQEQSDLNEKAADAREALTALLPKENGR